MRHLLSEVKKLQKIAGILKESSIPNNNELKESKNNNGYIIYLLEKKLLSEAITPKEKARLIALINKKLDDPNTSKEDINKIKSAIVSGKLKIASKNREDNVKNTLGKYASKAKLPTIIQKIIDASEASPEEKFKFEKYIQDEKNLITKEKLIKNQQGNLLDLVGDQLKNNGVFKDVSDYLLTFKQRGKGIGEAWLLMFGKNPNPKGEGDVNIDGYSIEAKDGEGTFSVDSKLTKNKRIHDKLNDEFFSSFNTSDETLAKLGLDKEKAEKQAKIDQDKLNKASNKEKLKLSKQKDREDNRNSFGLSRLKGYLSGKERKPRASIIPNDAYIKKHAPEIDIKQVKLLREKLILKELLFLIIKDNSLLLEKKDSPGLDYTNNEIKSFLIKTKSKSPTKLYKALLKYYNTLYDGSDDPIEPLVDYIFKNLSNPEKIVNAISVFLIKQYFIKEKFDSLFIVHPSNLKYVLLTKDYVNKLKFSTSLPSNLMYMPRWRRGTDSQNVADGWVNIKFKD